MFFRIDADPRGSGRISVDEVLEEKNLVTLQHHAVRSSVKQPPYRSLGPREKLNEIRDDRPLERCIRKDFFHIAVVGVKTDDALCPTVIGDIK